MGNLEVLCHQAARVAVAHTIKAQTPSLALRLCPLKLPTDEQMLNGSQEH